MWMTPSSIQVVCPRGHCYDYHDCIDYYYYFEEGRQEVVTRGLNLVTLGVYLSLHSVVLVAIVVDGARVVEIPMGTVMTIMMSMNE